MAPLLAVVSAYIWFDHSGFDVRSDMIQILSIYFFTIALISSVTLQLISKFTRSKYIWVPAYFLGLIAMVLVSPFIEKYYGVHFR